jgi:SAM-dependent methyltransferase
MEINFRGVLQYMKDKKVLLEEKKIFFMKAQIPFNNAKTEEINLSYYNNNRDLRDIRDLEIMNMNLKELNFDFLNCKNFLDIGFGTGKFILQLSKEYNINFYGIEPLKSVFLKFITSNDIPLNLQVKNCHLEDYEPKIKFDCIHSFFVLEHMINPLIMFEKSYKLLNKNGRLIFTCSNSSSFIKGRHEIESHRWIPDLKTILKILHKYNFIVEKYFTYGGFSQPRNIIKNFGNKLIKKLKIGDVMCLMAKKE